ncbi:hypothetical protein BJ165DRAFT_1446416 [Panaeolus papilionaceus]|nr:hypothetical protein BJ165DRAFT_1446416 [Panaeolus papilionaceus]
MGPAGDTMASPVVNIVTDGFSTTNRWILYASMMFTPAQFMGGLGSHSPVNIGFLAYNIWQQYKWYIAAQNRDLHALSLLPQYFNFIYAITYLGGIPAGNVYMTSVSGLGAAALVIMNCITAWISYKTNLPEGDGVYQFFFFGWRRLTKGWRTFFLLWNIGDTGLTFVMLLATYQVVRWTNAANKIAKDDAYKAWRASSLFWGSLVVLIVIWPLIMWMELIIKRNNIVSETDMIAIYLFIGQAILIVIPNIWDVIELIFGEWTEWKIARPLVRIIDKLNCCNSPEQAPNDGDSSC